MKKVLVFLLIAALVISFASCTKTSENQETTGAETETAVEPVSEPVTIKYADFHATSTVQWKGVEKFKALVEEKSGGNITVETYPNGQLGSQAELIESVKSNTIQMTYGNPPTLSNYVPVFAVLDLPYMFSSYDHIEKVVYGEVGDKLNQELIDATGMRILTWTHSGFRDMLTNDIPINTLEDFEGVKFRSPEAFAFVKMFEALNATPTPLPWTEVYESVRTNIVDGLETTTEAIVSNKFWEVCKYVMVSHHIYTAETPLINENFWQSLSAEQQGWISDSLAEVAEWQNGEIKKNEAGFYDTMKENGMELIYIDTEPLINACSVVWDEFIEKNAASKEYIDAIDGQR